MGRCLERLATNLYSRVVFGPGFSVGIGIVPTRTGRDDAVDLARFGTGMARRRGVRGALGPQLFSRPVSAGGRRAAAGDPGDPHRRRVAQRYAAPPRRAVAARLRGVGKE